MSFERYFYIDGAWCEPAVPRSVEVIDPATEEPFTEVAMGSALDAERAVAAAKRAFPAFSRTSREERIALLMRILEAYRARMDDIARVLPREMGATTALAKGQAASGAAHIAKTIEVLKTFSFEEEKQGARVLYQPIGVCALISPWNNPVSQVITKAIPAIAAGCTTVNKPSELAPVAVSIFAEVMNEAGVPKGVFNLLNGEGVTVGRALSSNPDVDMVAITGSTVAGIAVAKAAAETVKRVQQELGGKGPNIILADADLKTAVASGVASCFFFGGQTCGAPTRMLVPESLLGRVIEIARAAAEATKVGPPEMPGVDYGPAISAAQFEKVQRLIKSGIGEGAELITGGLGRPQGLERGYYCKPTIFAGVTPEMTIAREEIFGPVLSILTYRDEDEAIRIANDTDYGLVGYVQGGDRSRAERIARQIRCGYVSVNNPPLNISMPHGGYKRSGNGRQWAEYGLAEYLEMTALVLPPS